MTGTVTASSQPAARRSRWTSLLRTLCVFQLAALAGVILFACRLSAVGRCDPFDYEWRIYIQLGSLLLTLLLGAMSRRPFVTALGLFSGLIWYMLLHGRPAYPFSSVVFLIMTGLLPALTTAGILTLFRRAVGWYAKGLPERR